MDEGKKENAGGCGDELRNGSLIMQPPAHLKERK